jgi:hypothetical protein
MAQPIATPSASRAASARPPVGGESAFLNFVSNLTAAASVAEARSAHVSPSSSAMSTPISGSPLVLPQMGPGGHGLPYLMLPGAVLGPSYGRSAAGDATGSSATPPQVKPEAGRLGPGTVLAMTETDVPMNGDYLLHMPTSGTDRRTRAHPPLFFPG